MADSNRIALGYAEESTWGTTPAGALNEFRFASESLKPSVQTARSAEIRSDRKTVDVLRLAMQPVGSVGCELSYLSHDAIIRGALWGAAYTSPVTATGAVFSATSGAAQRYNRSSGDFVTDGFTVGSWVRVSGFANSANNGVFKVLSVATGTLGVTGGTLVTESAPASATFKQAAETVGGTTQVSFSLEKQFTDNTNDYEITKGALVDSWSVVVPTAGVVTHEFGFMGKSIASAAATAGSGSLTTVSSAPVIPAVTGVNKVVEGYSSSNAAITAFTASGFTLGVRNNLSVQNSIGTLGPTDYGIGSQDIEGTLDAYYSSPTLVDKVLNATALTASSLAVVFQDTSGNYIVLEVPSIKYVDAGRIAGGRDQDVVMRMRWQARRDSTEGAQIRYGKIAA